jgi:hypothetical protein
MNSFSRYFFFPANSRSTNLCVFICHNFHRLFYYCFVVIVVVVIIMQGWNSRPDSGCHTKSIQSQSPQKIKNKILFFICDMERSD